MSDVPMTGAAPTCEVVSRFRSEDAISAIRVPNKVFLMFNHECCVRSEKDGSVATIISLSEDNDRFIFITLVMASSLWLVSRHGVIHVVSVTSEEVIASEHTHLEVLRVFPAHDGVGVVFATSPTEVAFLVEEEGSLSVAKTLEASANVQCAHSSAQRIVVGTLTRALLFEKDVDTPVAFDLKGAVVACCVAADAWIGLDSGALAVARPGQPLAFFRSAHASRIISLIDRGDDTVWSFDVNGIAVAWRARDCAPIGSFRITQRLECLLPGWTQTYLQTSLCGVTHGEVVCWQLTSEQGGQQTSPPSTQSSAAQEVAYLKHLCDILCATDEDLEAFRTTGADEFLPLSFAHPALSYLPDAVLSLSETRSLLCRSFDEWGFELAGLKDDVSFLINNYRSLRETSSSVCAKLARLLKVDSDALAVLGLSDQLERIVDAVVERVEASDARERSEYVLEKRIADLNVELDDRMKEIQDTHSKLSGLREEMTACSSHLAEATSKATSQQIRIEALTEQLSFAEKELLRTQHDLRDKMSELERTKALFAESEDSFSRAQRQLEQELEDLTQNEVALMGRLKHYQSQAATFRASTRSCLKLISRDSKYSSLAEKLKESLDLGEDRNHTVDK